MRALSPSHVAFYTSWLIAFAVIELPASMDGDKGDTFSEMIWYFMELNWEAWFLVSGFSLWLFLHFALNRFVK